jgi:NAD(P)-dependent dehydrogenase (short-subunit alcohol dehydrogenase family)
MPSVFITGGGKRIGKALALGFAEKGWDVAISYLQSEPSALYVIDKIKSFDRKAFAVKVDLRIKSDIEDAFNKLYNEFGIPDVLINNAGVFPDKMTLSDISQEIWEDTLDINLRSTLFTSQQYIKQAKYGGKIINIASLGGLEVWKQRIPYNVSKAGLIQLTKALARELAPNISVNAICPGSINIEDDSSDIDKTLLDINKIPMGRLGNTDDVFDAVYFFATCSQYITAQTITVDGGYHDAR